MNFSASFHQPFRPLDVTEEMDKKFKCLSSTLTCHETCDEFRILEQETREALSDGVMKPLIGDLIK